MSDWTGALDYLKYQEQLKRLEDKAEEFKKENKRLHQELQRLEEMNTPEGWKLVPIEPTREMIRAGAFAGTDTFNAPPADAYVAMLAAAPTPTAQEGEPVYQVLRKEGWDWDTVSGDEYKRLQELKMHGRRILHPTDDGLRKAAEMKEMK